MKKIFLIDDEPNILEALTFILRDVAYDVIASLNGEVLRSLSLDDLPDLIIIDAWLSTEDGVEVVRALKKDKEFEKIPVIVISADASVEESARNAGAINFLAKPFGAVAFLDAVEKALK